MTKECTKCKLEIPDYLRRAYEANKNAGPHLGRFREGVHRGFEQLSARWVTFLIEQEEKDVEQKM